MGAQPSGLLPSQPHLSAGSALPLFHTKWYSHAHNVLWPQGTPSVPVRCPGRCHPSGLLEAPRPTPTESPCCPPILSPVSCLHLPFPAAIAWASFFGPPFWPRGRPEHWTATSLFYFSPVLCCNQILCPLKTGTSGAGGWQWSMSSTGYSEVQPGNPALSVPSSSPSLPHTPEAQGPGPFGVCVVQQSFG